MLLKTLTLSLLPFLFQGDGKPNNSKSQQPTLFLVVDGATITHAELIRWASINWKDMVNTLDSEGDGIRVSPLLANRTDREAVIKDLMRHLQEDLAPFGITVVRHTGHVVEGQGATTIFLGKSDLSAGYHVACDVDFSNNNATDIAFVGDEDWGDAASTAMALADVTLHEAGHTYGLYHVNCDQSGVLYAESMGLRYSSAQSQWLRKTSFMDRMFPEYLNHGSGHGPQNSYRTMKSFFDTRRVTPSLVEPRVPRRVLVECWAQHGQEHRRKSR
jgi:hypothetical protein